MSWQNVPKAELHVHIEGTISPQLAMVMAARNNVAIDKKLIAPDHQSYAWGDDGTAETALKNFVHAYHEVSKCIKKPQDYTDLTADYLNRSAAQGSIYCELMISPEMTGVTGISYPDMVTAVAKGVDIARAARGIECRLISTAVRNSGPKAATACARITLDHPHPYVTGFGLAGDENAYAYDDFKEAFDIARAGGLGLTAHGGEAGGPENVRAAIEILGVRRVGHMVRAIEDDGLMQELVQKNVAPEVCVSSNMFLKVYADVKDHPLRKFFDLGLPVTIATDDPGFFACDIAGEYRIAQEKFGFTDDDLKKLTRNAIEKAFIDDATRQKLLRKV